MVDGANFLEHLQDCEVVMNALQQYIAEDAGASRQRWDDCTKEMLDVLQKHDLSMADSLVITVALLANVAVEAACISPEATVGLRGTLTALAALAYQSVEHSAKTRNVQ
jgi:hypothetical protein